MKAAPRPKCDVGYFLRTYPRLSQTFIVNEILELERRGLKLAILGAWRPDDGLFHEAIGRVRTQADYLPETRWRLWVKTWRSMLPHLRRMTPAGRRALAAAWLRRRVTTRQLLLALGVLRWVHKRKVRHVHVHFGGEEATVAFLAHLLGGLSYSVTLHAFDIFRDNVNPALLLAKALAARFVVTVSEYNRRYLLERFPQLDPQRLHVCYNGIDLDRFCPAKVEREPNLVAAVGRLTEKKGFIHLLRALATLRQRGLAVRCALAGTGPDEARLRAEAKRLNIEDRIEWLGDVKQDDVRDLMRRAACLALPCIEAADGNMDALPTVLIESLA